MSYSHHSSKNKFPLLSFILLLLLVVTGAIGAYWQYARPVILSDQTPIKSPENQDPYGAFASEVYQKIKENYWDKISDEKLSELFRLAAEKVSSRPQTLLSKDQTGMQQLLLQLLQDLSEEKKEDAAVRLADLVLANLQPFGRSRIYTSLQSEKLKNVVGNVDPKTDLYAILGLSPETTPEEITKIYRQKTAALKKSASPQATEDLAQLIRAYETLATPENKKRYNQTKAEPTVVSKLLHPDIFYLKLTKFSPQSFEEFQIAANTVDPQKKNGPTTLIFDLRHNIGGAIDILPYFLGPFIGPDQYAYEFFHQEERLPFKTKTGWLKSLARYKKIVVLVDRESQSSAEVMVATLKKYHAGVIVGTTTKGWGTIEQLFPLEQRVAGELSLLLVQSIALREDGQPIEGRGVEPMVNINDSDWPRQLSAYFNYPALITVLKDLWK